MEIKLTKEVKELYSENYKTVIKENEDYTKNGKISHALGVEELILLKCLYYPNQSTDLINPYQKTYDIFHRTETSNYNI